MGRTKGHTTASSIPEDKEELGGNPQTLAYGPEIIAPWAGQRDKYNALKKLIHFLRQMYNENQIQMELNAYKVGGMTRDELLDAAGDIDGPDSATVCNLPCFANIDGKSLQDTGISSADVLTTERANAALALDDKLGFGDTSDSGNPKTATVEDLSDLISPDPPFTESPYDTLTSDETDFDLNLDESAIEQIYIDPDADGWTIESIVAPVDVTYMLRLTNVDTAHSFILANEGSGDAENRIITGLGLDATIGPGATAVLVYDLSAERWRLDV